MEEDQMGTSRGTSVVSHVNRYLPTPEKDQWLREFHSQHWNTTKRLKRLQHKLVVAIEEKGISIDKSMHGDLTQIMNECADKVAAQHQVGSLADVLF